jgi:tetratricopeptide (TPR) repeat protein
MPDQPQIRQKAAAERDAYVAGRDLIVNVGGADAATLGVPGLLPRDVPGFTGRDDELARLAGLADGERVVVTVIGGAAGVGKTALAVHAAHQLADEFPDGHLYADLRGYTEGQDPVQPGEVLETFLRSLGVPAEKVPAKAEERSGLLRQMLASRRVLMVLDNARTEAQIRALLPGAGGSLVLVTSRSVLPGLEADERISLDVLTADEAVAMLAGLAGTARAAIDPEAVAEVARLCGRLPLALRIAGQILAAHVVWPVTRLAGMLAGEQDRLAQLGTGDLQVRTAFEVSYRQLPEGDARLFRLLGLHPGPDFTAAAAAALAGTEDEAVEPALGRLAEAYLLTEDAAGRFGIHDLLRLFARSTCRDTDSQADREAAEARLVRHYADRARFLKSRFDQEVRAALARIAEQGPEQDPKPGLQSVHDALRIRFAERRSLLAVAGLAAQHGWDEQLLQLSESMDDSLFDRDELVSVREAAVAAARRTGDTRAASMALKNLGEAYQSLQRFEEAVICYRQLLAIRRETGDRDGESHTLDNIGEAYQNLQRFEEAVTSYQQSLVVKREIGDRHGEGQTLNNLGHAYLELRRSEEAITSYQEAVTIRRETGDQRGEGRFLNNLGDAYQQLLQPDRAAACWREAAAAMRGAGDHEAATRLEQLAANTRSRRRWWVLHQRSSS